jgi:hypothetical protein
MVAVSSAVEVKKPKQACIREGAGEETERAVIGEPNHGSAAERPVHVQ